MTAYATTSQLKEVLGITGSDQDGYLAGILDRVSAFIDTYTGRTFSGSAITVTDELYERQSRVIWLRNVGITEVDSVKARDFRSDSLMTLDATNYQWTSAGRLELPICYTFVQVTYEHQTAVPKDIEGACLALAAEGYRSGGEHGDVRREEIGDLVFEYQANSGSASAASVNRAMQTLDSYRVRHV